MIPAKRFFSFFCCRQLGLAERPREWLPRRPFLSGAICERDLSKVFRELTSARSCSNTSATCVELIEETVGLATSVTLSASYASFCRSAESSCTEARIILTFEGKRCRKTVHKGRNCLQKLLSHPVVACYKGVVSVFSHLSSVVNNCCKRRCSEAAVRLTSCSLSVSYGFVAGGVRMRSLTSVAYSGASNATEWSNFVFCTMIPLVVN